MQAITPCGVIKAWLREHPYIQCLWLPTGVSQTQMTIAKSTVKPSGENLVACQG
ncbi:hypothetical protein H8E77_14475 [bacterium]|nr:hypothetical protein [bacterium]